MENPALLPGMRRKALLALLWGQARTPSDRASANRRCSTRKSRDQWLRHPLRSSRLNLAADWSGIVALEAVLKPSRDEDASLHGQDASHAHTLGILSGAA